MNDNEKPEKTNDEKAPSEKHGITLRVLNIGILIFAILLSVALFFVIRKIDSIYSDTHSLTQTLIEAREKSDDVLEASDYLTEQIRTFVVTGERKYLDAYLDEINTAKRRDKAIENLKNISSESETIRELEEAIAASRELEEREYTAAHLAVSGFGYDLSKYPAVIRSHEPDASCESLSPEEKKKKAIDLLFDAEYHSAKANISSHTKACLDRLLSKMHSSQLDASSELRSLLLVEHILSVVLMITILVMVLLNSILIIRPVSNAVERIRKEEDIPLEGAYEMRFLAKTYNLMNNTHALSSKKLNYEANHDKLTGLYNRRGYDFLLKNTDLETSALMIIDLDKFKAINDHYGHEVGDKVLKKVADAIFSSFRSDDLVCRIGGDEFAVILIHLGPSLRNLVLAKYEAISEKLKDGSDGIPPVTISTGVAFGEYRIGASALFKNADRALYRAKEAGRGTIRFHKYSIQEIEHTNTN